LPGPDLSLQDVDDGFQVHNIHVHCPASYRLKMQISQTLFGNPNAFYRFVVVAAKK
jgi:hypothetical protein